MFKRLMLSSIFIAALGAAGLGMSSNAAAWDDCYDSGYRTAYYPPYTAYPAYYGYAPRVEVYRAPVLVRNFDIHDGHHHHHHHDYDRNHISFSFGF